MRPAADSRRFRNRLRRVVVGTGRALFPRIPPGDRAFALLEFLLAYGRLPERRPVRYVDHLFARRVDGSLREPLRCFVSDKEYAKMFIELRVGARYNMRTYALLRTVGEVESFVPDRFPCVVKPTAASHFIRLAHGPGDYPDRETLRRWLALDFHRDGREWNYRHLRQKILVEEFFTVDGRRHAPEYRMFCFRGKPRFIMEAIDRQRIGSTFYDPEWRRLEVAIRGRPNPVTAKPPRLGLMLDLAERLSAPFDFLRVDLYATDSEVRVGELTHCPDRALQVLEPASAQYDLGRHFRGDAASGHS